MNFNLFTFFKKKEKKTLQLPDSILVKKLKAVSDKNSFSLFNNVSIYHHAKTHHIPLMILDNSRGLFIFEKKEWSYAELKNSSISKAQNQNSTKDTLSFQNNQNIIKQKFNELTHTDGVPIFNYLLMENINSDEYEYLNDAFKELLPKNKIIFSDSSQDEILQKLAVPNVYQKHSIQTNEVIGNLLVQYTILDENNCLKICTHEQINFLDSQITGLQTLQAKEKSGKSSLLLLKSILEILKNKEKKIVIIKPTQLACDILKKKLLEVIEHAIINVNIDFIQILTPLELINKHLKNLHKKSILSSVTIDEILMKKKFHIADLILCDDAYLLNENFLQYLIHIQKNSNLLLVNSNVRAPTHKFTYSFFNSNVLINFYKANEHAKALQIISKLLLHTEAKDILVIGDIESQRKLYNDLEYFIHEETQLLDTTKNLRNQHLDSLILCGYDDTNALFAQDIILLDIDLNMLSKIEYALSLAQKSVSVLYSEDCAKINTLKEKYEIQ